MRNLLIVSWHHLQVPYKMNCVISNIKSTTFICLDFQADVDQLLKACERGDLSAVKGIVEGLGVDVVNATGEYGQIPLRKSSRLMEEERVSPLFLAAGFCHLDIAQYLIDQGADVNSRCSSDGRLLKYGRMTPLHSAICLRTDKTFSQKRAMIELLISNGADATAVTVGGCNMWKIFYDQRVETSLIIDLGVRLTRQFPGKNLAVLHYWTSSDNVRFIELLLGAGADLKSLDYYGFNTLNMAAIGFDGKNESVLRYLLARDEFSLSEKVLALELVGAMILLKATDDSIPSEAFRFWIESLNLRENAQGSIVPKVSLNVESNVAWRSVEWTTREELVQLQHGSLGQMKIQAILVARRILSSISSKALACDIWFDHVESYYSDLFCEDRFTEVLEIYWIFLEGARVAGDLSDRDLWEKVADATSCIIDALLELEQEQNLNSETLNLSFELIFNEMHNRWPTQAQLDHCNRTPMSAIYQLVLILLRSPAEMATEEIKEFLRRFVERDSRNM